jgi:hypothetical protein
LGLATKVFKELDFFECEQELCEASS